tara:strand:- start:315 stop:1088 length:774 start_codon:yes stop_codon:yes gene_type:complete
MANKEQEQQQVEEQVDPIVAGAGAEETISVDPQLEEGVESSEATDWEAEAKKFQSMYDKKTAEHQAIMQESQDLFQLRDALNSRPELVDVIEKTLDGQSEAGNVAESSTTPDNFDPWDAYYKPDSESYQYRVSQEKKLVHETVDNELGRLKNEMAMNNLRNELVTQHNMGADDAQDFLRFATTPKANLPIDTLIKVWKEGKGSSSKPNENKQAVQAAKKVPKPAGVLQGGEQPKPNEKDEVWDRIMSSSSSGRLAKP